MNTIETVQKSLKLLIDFVDSEMTKNPSKELAKVSNALQEAYDEIS